MSHLLRRHAPITAEGWQGIDDEARERLTCRASVPAVWSTSSARTAGSTRRRTWAG